MEIVVRDGSGDNHWSRGWADRFADAIPAETKPVQVEMNVSGRSQISLKVRHQDMATICMLNSDRSSDPEHRARQYGQWFLGKPQQELFESVRRHEAGPIMVERAAVLAAAMKVNGAEFADAVRTAVSSSVARFKGGRPDIRIGMDSHTAAPGLMVRNKAGEHPTVRLRARAFRLTHLTFTPQVEMTLPGSVIDAMTGKPLDMFVDHPLVRDCGLIVSHVTCAGGMKGGAGSRTSIHLNSDLIDLEEAACLIDARRALT